jgi:peptidoglycan/LPS O-acetylase OafA/YrhL
MALCAAIFLAAYYLFANAGGFYGSETSPVWIVLPTIEASFCAVLIAWYDQSFQFGSSGFSGVLARIGTYSYSIYLLHPFLVFRAAPFINRFVDLRNFYICLIAAVLSFLIMALIGALSFHAYEAFFLRFRRKYVLPDALATMTDEAPLASSA